MTFLILELVGNTCIVGLSNMIKQIDLRSGEVVRAINKKSNGSHIPGFVRELYVDEDKLLFSTTEGKLGVVDWNSGKVSHCLSPLFFTTFASIILVILLIAIYILNTVSDPFTVSSDSRSFVPLTSATLFRL